MPDKQIQDTIGIMLSVSRKLRHNLHLADSEVSQITIAQIEALKCISEHQNMLMKDLAKNLSITPPSATVVANHLIRLKLITRNISSLDGRVTFLSLTKKGSTMLKKITEKRKKSLANLLKKLNTSEQATLLTLMKKFIS